MKEPFPVLWTDVARQDLGKIIDYVLVRDGYSTALDLFRLIEKKSETLHSQPFRCRKVPELVAINVENYRELIVSPYRIFFRTEDRKVLVLGVFDGRRDLEQVLVGRVVDHL